MRKSVFSALAVALSFAGTASFGEQIAIGTVNAFDRSERTFWVAGQQYVVPQGKSLKGVYSGDEVRVRWDQQQGPMRVVEAFSIEESSEGR